MFPARFPGSAPARLAIGSYLLRHRRRCPSSQRCVGVRGPYPNAIGSYLYPIWVGSAAAALAVGALSEGETFSSAWTAVGSELLKVADDPAWTTVGSGHAASGSVSPSLGSLWTAAWGCSSGKLCCSSLVSPWAARRGADRQDARMWASQVAHGCRRQWPSRAERCSTALDLWSWALSPGPLGELGELPVR